MKITEHRHGEKTYLIYDIEMDPNHTLRISPGVIDGGYPGAVFTFKIVGGAPGRGESHTAIAIPKGKIEEIREAIDEAIKDIKKRG